ncbi:hypothetical protein O0L34_g15396 [Tuta absoluta]|nr:hypothetical protein O0L34_g15396 [Tuta absoluta]
MIWPRSSYIMALGKSLHTHVTEWTVTEWTVAELSVTEWTVTEWTLEYHSLWKRWTCLGLSRATSGTRDALGKLPRCMIWPRSSYIMALGKSLHTHVTEWTVTEWTLEYHSLWKRWTCLGLSRATSGTRDALGKLPRCMIWPRSSYIMALGKSLHTHVTEWTVTEWTVTELTVTEWTVTEWTVTEWTLEYHSLWKRWTCLGLSRATSGTRDALGKLPRCMIWPRSSYIMALGKSLHTHVTEWTVTEWTVTDWTVTEWTVTEWTVTEWTVTEWTVTE